MDVNSTDVLKRPLIVPHKILMGPGPSNCSSKILEAISQPLLGHLHKECIQIMDDVKVGIKYIFNTKNDLTLALSASGHGGMETVFCNLIEKGEKVLIAVNGFWGLRAMDIAQRYGAKVITMNTDPGNNFTLAEFEIALKKNKPSLLFVIQGETSTGVYQPIENLGVICHKYNCLLAVDTVASLGCVPLFTDKWEIDAVYTGSQKILGAPPGITPISFSERAKKKIFQRKSKVPVFYFDVKLLGEYWGCFENPIRPYHHTISSTLLYGLRTALAQFIDEGYKNVIIRHQESARLLYKGLTKLGLELYVFDETKRLPSVTTVKIPSYLNGKAIIEYVMEKHSIEISGGMGPTADKVFRIGVMGFNAIPSRIEQLLDVLKEAINFEEIFSKSKL